MKGDYFNLYADVDLNLQDVLQNLGRSRQNALAGVVPGSLTGGTSGTQPNSAPPLPLNLGQTALPAAPQGTTPAPPTGVAGIFGLLAGGG